MKEKRKQPRRQADEFLIVCDSQTAAFIGQVANMTEQGAMLLSEKPIQLNTTVECKMTLPKSTDGKDYVSFEAESKWCTHDEKTGMYRTGYEFQKMTPDDHAIIQELLKFWSVTQPEAIKA